MAELVNGGTSTDDHPVVDDAVTSEHGTGRQLDVVAHDGVMADVAVGHEVVVVGDASWFLGLATMDGDSFAKDVPITDDQSRRFLVWIEVDVLGRTAKYGSGPEHVGFAHAGLSEHVAVGHDLRAGADLDRALQRAEWAHDDIVSEFHVAFNDRCRVDGGHEQA